MTRSTIYGFVAAEKTTYPVRLLCRVLQVSTSAFYDWLHHGRPTLSEEDLADAHDANLLREAWVEHRRTYGARRLTAEIHDRGHAWNRKKVARLMTVAGIRRRAPPTPRQEALSAGLRLDRSRPGEAEVHRRAAGPVVGR